MAGPEERSRTRVWRADAHKLSTRFYFQPTPVVSYGETRVTGKQVTVSEGHPWPYSGKGLKDIGGDFSTTNHSYDDFRGNNPGARPVHQVKGRSSAREVTYSGPIYAVDPIETSNYSPYPKLEDVAFKDDLDALGSTAIARCSPTNSSADVSVALAELIREGIPNIIGAAYWKQGIARAKSHGDEYLNYQFGWKPLVSSIIDTAKAADQAERIWTQYKRDAGRVVRRRYEFPHEQQTLPAEIVSITARPILRGISSISDTDYVTQGGTLTRERSISKRTWFSGAFTYGLPEESDNLARSAAYARKVYGAKLDPEVLWNLAPWSWAVDWVTNTGDLVRNASAFGQYGLVMPYGYVMQHVSITDTYLLKGFKWGPENQGLPSSFRCQFTTEVKRRRRATPFGFGLDLDGFTAGQWAILAALGVSRR